MRRRLAILALLTAALAVPAQSPAAERDPLLPPPLPSSPLLSFDADLLSHNGGAAARRSFFRSGFVVDADGGYRVGVSTSGNAVMLEVWRGQRGKRIVTAYLARGVAAPERLQATFGNFGRVSMRFRESRNRPWLGKRRNCRDKSRFVKRRGVFVGNLRFRGENGYVSVRVHRARGAIVTEARKCRGSRSRGLPDLDFFFFFLEPKAALLAVDRDGVDSTAFLALARERKTLFLAADEETRGKLAIVRLAVAQGRKPIQVNEALTSATVSPPAPFHGTGRYRAFPDGTATWSGGISVDFPGAPRFPLAGPDFETLLEVPF